MKIVLTRSMLPGDIAYIRDGLDRVIAGRYELLIPPSFDEETLVGLVGDADVLLGPYVTSSIVHAAHNLKLIQVPWTGMDTFNFEAVRGSGITICNTHSNAASVAELALTLVLDLLKKVSYHDRKMRVGNWNRDLTPLGLGSRMLRKEVVCVLGYGNIGSRVGELAAAFGAEVIAVDDFAKSDVAKVFSTDAMLEALAQASVVICTVPLMDATKGLLGGEAIESMRNDALLVNMSRAGLVDEDAVWDAPVSKKLGGYAADVWWKTPSRGESKSWPSEVHPFWKLDNVVMSPHRAGFVEGSLPHLDGAIDNIIALMSGSELSSRVDIDREF